VPSLTLSALDRGIRVRSDDRPALALLGAAYGALRGRAGEIALDYTVGRAGAAAGFVIERRGRTPMRAPDAGGLLALFDEDVTVELQKLRPDAYVVHAAVLKHQDGVVALVARSGGGKSTLGWALLHHGLGYASDELAPVDLATLEVHPYPRALILKRRPPPAYPLAAPTLHTSRGFHVAAEHMPADICTSPAPLTAVFFVDYRSDAAAPSARALSTAEAAARLYANSLNPLAHAGEGLDGAIRIAAACPSFALVAGDLPATCALVIATLQRLY
jgi:hypothetical protein